MRSWSRWIPNAIITVGLAGAAWSAVRFSLASWWLTKGDAGACHRSVSWWPERADASVRLAALEPAREKDYLDAALAREPRSGHLLVARAMVAEFEGDLAGAKDLLEQAMRADRGFRPVWAWLGFVARREPSREFWVQARRAFQMSFGDRAALFDLCWSVRPDGQFLWREVVTRQAPVLFDFVQFLMRQGDLNTARESFKALLDQPYGSLARANAGRVATREERTHLGLDLCDLLLDRRQPPAAAEVWTLLRNKGLAGEEAVGRCLDYRPAQMADGVHVSRSGESWTLEFTGRQADEIDLLWRPAAGLPPSAPPPDSRLLWLNKTANGALREVLVYRREAGQVPLRGTLAVTGSAGRSATP